MHVVWIILGIIVFIICFVLWSTVTLDIASNGKKTIITASMYRFLKYEIVLPKPSELDEDKQEPDAEQKADTTENETMGNEFSEKEFHGNRRNIAEQKAGTADSADNDSIGKDQILKSRKLIRPAAQIIIPLKQIKDFMKIKKVLWEPLKRI